MYYIEQVMDHKMCVIIIYQAWNELLKDYGINQTKSITIMIRCTVPVTRYILLDVPKYDSSQMEKPAA